jgi:hypothetical protein
MERLSGLARTTLGEAVAPATNHNSARIGLGRRNRREPYENPHPGLPDISA